MPRANRHFLPGYVWHITINTAVNSHRSKRSTAALSSNRFGIDTLEEIWREERRYNVMEKQGFRLAAPNEGQSICFSQFELFGEQLVGTMSRFGIVSPGYYH